MLRSTKGAGFWGGLFSRLSTWFALLLILYAIFSLLPQLMIRVFLMFAAMFLPGLLLWGLLAATTYEALRGYLPRVWLALPVGFLVAFFAITIAQRVSQAELESAWRLENAAPQRVFNPTTDTVLFETSGAKSLFGIEAASLVENYDVPGAYAKLVQRFPRGKTPVRESWRFLSPLVSGGCPAGSALWRALYQAENGRAPQACNTSLRSAPDITPIVVRTTYGVTYTWGTKVSTTRTTLTLPDGSVRGWTTASADRWGWVPFLVAGCGLVSWGASWNCFAAFQPEHVDYFRELPPGYRGYTRAAYLLGVAPRKSPATVK